MNEGFAVPRPGFRHQPATLQCFRKYPLHDFLLRRAVSHECFNSGVARHHFCTVCGIQPFSRPRSHPSDYDVNVRCLDDDALERFDVKSFDGKNWEQSVDAIR